MKALATMTSIGILLAAAAGASAQDAAFGFKVGATLARLAESPAERDVELTTRSGILIGGFAAIPLGSRTALQPEVFFTERGTRVEFDTGDYVRPYLVNLSFLEVPVLFRHELADGDARPYLLLGPSIGFRLSATTSRYRQSIDFTEFVESTEISLVFGLGVDLRKFLIEARYNHGLSDLRASGETAWHTRALGLLVGRQF